MKAINYIRYNVFALLFVFVYTSCSIEVEPQNEITLEKFWNEKIDVENILAGCYSTMQQSPILGRMMIWGEFRSENVLMRGTSIEKDRSLQYVLTEQINTTNYYTLWGDFYSVINRCNTIIHYAPQVAEVDPSYKISEVEAHIAEATAIRSLMYFYLIRTFRNVPYTTEAYLDDSQESATAPMDFYQVLDNCIQSLEAVKSKAVKKYIKSEYNRARITQCAINAMLCEMYLWKRDYQKCVDYADLVINEKLEDAKEFKSDEDYTQFYGYPLLKNAYGNSAFGRAFNNIFVSGVSNESIFELVFTGSTSELCNGPASLFYGNDVDVAGYVIPSDYVGKDKDVHKLFINKLDGRLYESVRYNSSGAPIAINKHTLSGGVNLKMKNENVSSITDNSDFFSGGSWGNRYSGKYENNNWVSYSKANWIIYRLADIMLLKAEALTQMIATDELSTSEDIALRDKAFELVNALERRATYKTSLSSNDGLKVDEYSSKTLITNLVCDERQRELLFEGKRYYDLVRRSMREGNTTYMRSKVQNKSTDLASIIDSKMQKFDYIFWPYHQDEVKANPALEPYQNRAFPGEKESTKNTAE